jgi:hypothetical protein
VLLEEQGDVRVTYMYAHNLEAMLARLIEARVTVLREFENMPSGERIATVADREGNPVALCRPPRRGAAAWGCLDGVALRTFACDRSIWRRIVASTGDAKVVGGRVTSFFAVEGVRGRALVVAGAVSIATVGLVACGGGSKSGAAKAGAGVKGPSEIAAAPVSTRGANPFTPKVGNDRPGLMPPTAAAGSSGGPVSYSAALPGLYGGTRNYATCDAAKLVNFLEQNPGQAAAWASTLGIRSSQISDYVSGLTAVLLRTDTRVTNHGYINGVADPIQSVLEAGTAVFVDKYGEPVVKCYCGNPLTPPVLYTTPVYTGPLWAGFSPTQITIIIESTTIINTFTLYDPTNGMLFTRTPGMHGRDGPYKGTSTSTTTSPGPTTPTPTSPQPTTPTPTSTSSTSTQTAPATTPAENPSVSLSPNPVTQGATVTLTASGFAPGASLDITVNLPNGVVQHFQMSAGADGTGTYTFSNAAGNAPLGTYNVTVTNPATSAQASASIVVLAPPSSTPTNTTTT